MNERAAIPAAPGLKVESTSDEIVIRVDRLHAMPLLWILLNSKFGYEPRWEFLANPYVNYLIEALMSDGDRKRFRAETDDPIGMAEVRQEVKRFAKIDGLDRDAEAELMWLAQFPWSLKEAAKIAAPLDD